MAIDLLADVAGDTVAVIIDGRNVPPTIVAGTGVRDVQRESLGTFIMTLDESPILTTSGAEPIVIEGARFRSVGAGGVFTSEIVSASQLRCRIYQNTGLVDDLFCLRIRRY